MITFDKVYYVNIDGDYTYKQPVAYCFCGLHRGYHLYMQESRMI